jgi:prepilin-type N-terminal cleavage/methylation domain-containing protein
LPSANTSPGRAAGRGFTLVELAMVLLIAGLLLISLMYTLTAASEQRARDDTNRRLTEARDLLLAFAVVKGRLPCPASFGGNGDESPAGGGACTDYYTGFLPGRALGMTGLDASGYALDAWNNRIRYAVSNNPAGNFTSAAALKAAGTVTVPGDLVVCGSAAGIVTGPPASCGAAASISNQNIVVAVIWSLGKNGGPSAYSGADEAANNKNRLPAVTNNHGVFVWHDARPAGGAGGEYDDLMVWIPVGQLYGRMIAAGVLP